MRNASQVRATFVWLFCLFVQCAFAQQQISGRVVKVSDGDTVQVMAGMHEGGSRRKVETQWLLADGYPEPPWEWRPARSSK